MSPMSSFCSDSSFDTTSAMEFAQSAPAALQRITDATGVSLILILSDINMPGITPLNPHSMARKK